MTVSPCPNCRSTNLFKSRDVSAGGGYAPNYLPGLGTFFTSEKFNVVLCGDCGLARFFARASATAKLRESQWERL